MPVARGTLGGQIFFPELESEHFFSAIVVASLHFLIVLDNTTGHALTEAQSVARL